MELNPGMLVYVNHYSGKNPIISSVIERADNNITVLITENLKKASVYKNDPIVINFESEKKLYTCEGYITKINSKEHIMELRIDTNQQMDNNRLFERFPVSLYANIKPVNKKKQVGVVKNISLGGLAISTKAELKTGSIYDLEIYVDERVIEFKGEIAWKKNEEQKNEEQKNEYGVKSIYPDYIVKNTIKLYLSILKNEQESIIKNAISSVGISKFDGHKM